MNYAVALILVLSAAVAFVIGFATDSTLVTLVAAAFSAAAAVLLYGRAKAARAKTFVTSAPPRLTPEWQRDEARRTAPLEPTPLEPFIPGYEQKVTAEILPSLETMSIDQLRMVIAWELQHLNRSTIISRAEALIRLTEASLERPMNGGVALADPEAPAITTARKRVAVKAPAIEEATIEEATIEEATIVKEEEPVAEPPVLKVPKQRSKKTSKEKETGLSI